MRNLSIILVLLLASFYVPNSQAGVPTTTTISYQGLLENNETAANGTFDFEFSLWDAEVNGNQIGAPILIQDIMVDKGVFLAELDFGAVAFDGSLRWLMIRVALSNNGLTTLTPRQRVTAAPVALYALDSPGGGAGGSLDDAYDSGGAGAGREILADSGEVHIFGTDGLRVDSGVIAGPASLGRPGTEFDIQARHSFTLGGNPPDPSTVGAYILDGNVLNPIEKWAYIRAGIVGNAIRRNVGSSLAFDTENSPNHPALFFTQMILNQDGDLGLGTPSPASRFHVTGGSDASASGGGYVVIGPTNSTNIIMDNNEIMARNNGVVARLVLNNDGGNVTISAATQNGNLGVGTNDPQTRIHVQDFPDLTLAGGGALTIGPNSSLNIAMDNNEIMARNNGATAPLTLNNDGGTVVTGADLSVNGTLNFGYQIVSSTANNASSSTANCPAGKKVLGGGCVVGVLNILITNLPISNGSGWFCAADDDDSSVTARAICARIN